MADENRLQLWLPAREEKYDSVVPAQSGYSASAAAADGDDEMRCRWFAGG